MLYADRIIKLLCYAGYITGLLMFLTPLISPIIRNKMYMHRIKSEYINAKKDNSTKLVRHLRMLISTVYGTKSFNAVVVFFTVSLILFFFTLYLTTSGGTFGLFSIVLAAVVGSAPYSYLRIRLRNLRIEGSYEAEGLVTELINQYKINYFNMSEAIDKTIAYLGKYPYSKKALFRLAIAVKDYNTENDLESAVYEFVYSIKTEWAQMLGMNIYISILNGTNVTESMEDILKDLKALKSVMERERRENNESFIMIKYLSVLMLALSVICELVVFRISPEKIADFQFGTSIGIKLTIAIIVSMLINFAMLYLYRKPKYDL